MIRIISICSLALLITGLLSCEKDQTSHTGCQELSREECEQSEGCIAYDATRFTATGSLERAFVACIDDEPCNSLGHDLFIYEPGSESCFLVGGCIPEGWATCDDQCTGTPCERLFCEGLSEATCLENPLCAPFAGYEASDTTRSSLFLGCAPAPLIAGTLCSDSPVTAYDTASEHCYVLTQGCANETFTTCCGSACEGTPCEGFSFPAECP